MVYDECFLCAMAMFPFSPPLGPRKSILLLYESTVPGLIRNLSRCHSVPCNVLPLRQPLNLHPHYVKLPCWKTSSSSSSFSLSMISSRACSSGTEASEAASWAESSSRSMTVFVARSLQLSPYLCLLEDAALFLFHFLSLDGNALSMCSGCLRQTWWWLALRFEETPDILTMCPIRLAWLCYVFVHQPQPCLFLFHLNLKVRRHAFLVVFELAIPLLPFVCEVVRIDHGFARHVFLIDASLAIVHKVLGVDKECGALQDGINVSFGGFFAETRPIHLPESRKLDVFQETFSFLDISFIGIWSHSSGLVLDPFDCTPPSPGHALIQANI